MRGFDNPENPREDAEERRRAEDWRCRDDYEHDHGITFAEAVELARTGDNEQVQRHWDRSRIALLHMWIQDQLDDLPDGVSATTVAKLEDALSGLRADLDRIVTA
jgi:hypothetical protein